MITRICLVLCLATPALAGDIITEDVGRFWTAFDRFPPNVTVEQAAEILQRDYLDRGTKGLDALRRARFKDARTLARRVLDARGYYAAIRDNTLEIADSPEIRASIERSFRTLQKIAGSHSAPDVYFTIGWLSTGGIDAEPGLIIGLEMFARDSTTPVDELGAWARANTRDRSLVPHIVAHELIHAFQRPKGKTTLLTQAIVEGAADYMAELISGRHINETAHAYGRPRFDELWSEFAAGIDDAEFGEWMYRQPADGRPADLGYFIGYEICRRYVERAENRDVALREVLTLRKPVRIFRGSGL